MAAAGSQPYSHSVPKPPHSPTPAGAAPPRRLAQYQLLRKVGSGAMGEVHQAHDLDLDRPVAIKLLHATSAADPALNERFLREARSAAQLMHPHVALVYQVGRHEGLTFIVMEWLDGGDLAHAVRQRGPLPWRDALAAVRDAAAGLAAAHAAGLVHRDIKPSNLMRSRSGQVKLVDFGLARLHATPSELTHGDGLLGTPAYLSPEQCAGEAATPQSDLYALACTGFHLLTGQAPFTASHVAAVLYAHLNKPLPDPRGWAPDLPAAVVGLLQRAAAKDPALRHASAAALLAELDAVLRGGAPGTPPAAGAPPAAHPAAATASSAPAHAAIPASAPPAAPATAHAAAPPPAPLPAHAVPADPPPPAAAAPGPLGSDHSSFIGREQLSAQVEATLRQARLLTLTGPGGTGKTRLALHAARRVAPGFADGAWLVELAPLSADQAADPHEAERMVWGTLAALFGLRDEAAGAADHADDPLLAHLAGRTLLLLDNCEHLLQAAAALAQRVLAHAPQVRILATSRQPLRVPGEQTLAVPALATGDPASPPAELARVEAVRLFAERAAAARPGFVLGPGNAATVARICRRLDGIPLAIELAAARTKVLAPAQIDARLDDAFRLLTGGQRTLLPRQQTLRALIDWSWNLLDERERRLLARCSVFAGDFSLDAAEVVLTDDGSGHGTAGAGGSASSGPGAAIDAIGVLDGLASLVDKSLLLATERGGEMRYRLLETIRQYGAERLQAAGETETLQRRHASFYSRLVCDAVAELNGPGHDAASARLQREHDNARAALDAVTAQRAFEIALPLARGLADYWFLHGALNDGVARLQRLIALEPPEGVALAQLIQPAGTLAMYLGLRELAQGWFERGLAMARAAADGALLARMLASLGALAVAGGNYPEARRWLEEALQQCRRVGDKTNAAKAHNNLGIALSSMGDNAGAREHLLAALALHRESRRQVDLANGMLSLAELEQAAGASEEAQGLFASSLDIFASLGDDWSAAYARDGLGRCALDHGDIAAARRHFKAALDALRRRGDKGAIADQLDYLAHVALLERQHDEAARLADESLALRLELNNPAWLAVSMETHAAVNVGRDPERSARLLGAMAALQEQAQARPTAMRERRQQVLQGALTRRLGEQAFERLRAEGARADPAALARGGR
jgi:non-specific serine/threonine protein kinase